METKEHETQSHSQSLISCQRKIRSFRANFEKMIAVVQFNTVHMLTAGNFRIIDVLEGHVLEILCMDVSQISKSIVSYSPGLLLVHAPIKSEGAFMSDHVISLGTLKWKEYWRQEMKGSVRNLSISQIGDFFSLSGDGIFTVWVRDTPTDFTFSQFVYHSRSDPKGTIAQVIKHDEGLGSVIQHEVTHDGRMIVCLEDKSKTVKIYYQDTLPQAKQSEEREKEDDYYRSDNYSRGGRGYYGGGFGRPKEDRVEVQLEYNPYAAENEGAAANPFEMQAQKTELKYQSDPISEYRLPKHKNTIEYFKMMHHDIFECEKRFLPNIIITVTDKNEVFVWQENMNSEDMDFICVHTLRSYGKADFFDAAFLDFPPINPKRYVEMKTNVSRLFDSEHDKNLILKKEENTLSIFKPNYVETSIDWILILNDQIIDIYKAEGLRNFPQRNVQVTLWNRYKMSYTPKDFYGSCKIVSASCRDFNDVISMYTLNSNGQLIKLRKDFKEQGQGKWRVDKVAILKRKYIQDVIPHTQLPIIAHLMNNTELYFFIEEKTKNRLVKESLTGGSMRFLGAYSIYHQSQQRPLQIVRAKWVSSPLCMMIVQFTNDTMALVSSQSQLRMLSHGKYQEEYLKLWDSFETHGLSSQAIEKWEKIYEVHFNQGKQQHHEATDEHLVDFEVIKSEVVINAFTVNLVVFTSFNQYLVYETHTQLLPHLKSLSQTKLLYHVYTTDCPLSLLGGIHFKSEWSIHASASSSKSAPGEQRTVIALMTEIDPQRQRPEKNRDEFVENSNPYDFGMDDEKVESESDDSDGGDIFAQFTGGDKKKDKLGLKKNPPPQKVEPNKQPIEELKPAVAVKMLQFDGESSKNKKATELWRVELPIGFKNRMLKCRASEQFFAFLTLDNSMDDKEQLLVYLYDMLQNKYLGYINLHAVTGLKELHVNQIDFIFSSASSKGSLTLYHKDTLFLIAESSREGLKGQWTLVRKFEKVLGLGKGLEIEHIRIQESFLRKQVLVVNKRILSVREKFTLQDKVVQRVFDNDFNSEEQKTVVEKLSLHNIYANAQKSFPIYHPKVLKRLFLKGYTALVLKILIQLSKSLNVAIAQNNTSSSSLISEFLEFDLGQIVEEVNQQIGSQTTATSGGQKKQETAAAMFGGWDDGDDDGDIFAVKKPAQAKPNNTQLEAVDTSQLANEFDEIFPSLVKKIKTIGDRTLGLKEEKYRLMFIDFLKRFKQLFRKEFFADILTQILLRDLFFDTEDIEQEEEEKVAATMAFNVKDYISQLKAQPTANSKANIASVKQWNSLQACLALHSEAQDVLLNELSERFDFEQNLTYELFKRLSISVWLKDVYKIKNLVQIIAKNEYKTTTDDFNKESKAEKTALWYVLIDKKEQLARLYKQEPENKKVYELLLNDFTQQKWKSTAEKNAMVLVSKKRNYLACAFFLLAGNIKDALFVAIDKMKDCVLGLLIARLFEKEDAFDQPKKEESKTEMLYREHFIERGKRLEDPYLQNIGHWQRKEYIQAVNVFHVEPQSVNTTRQGMFQMKLNIKEQDLFPVSEEGLDSDKDNLLLKQAAQAASTVKDLIPVPFPTTYDYNSLDIVKQMKKSTMVKRALQQTSTTSKIGGKFSNLGGGGGGASIFDDFFGGDEPEETNTKQVQKEEEVQVHSKLIVEEAKILEFVTLRASQTGYSLQAVVIMAENVEHLPKQGALSKQIIGLTLLSDFVNSPAFQYQSIKKLKATARLIIDKLDLNQDQVRSFILKQFKYTESFLMNVNYIAEDETLSEDEQKQEALSCVEEQALNMIDFVHSIADYPFSIVQDGKSHDFVSYTIKKAVGYLESLAESYIIVDMQIQHAQQLQTQKPTVAKQNTTAPKPALKNKISLTYADFQNDEGNYEFTVEEEKGNLDMKSIDIHKTKLQAAGIKLDSELDTGARTRIAVVLYLGLFQVCMISRKFFLLKDLLADIKTIFNKQDDPSQIGILMQKLKTSIQKLKYSLVPPKMEVKEDDFDAKFKETKQKTKEELEEELRHFKIDSFLHLWFHYLTSHWLQNQLRQAYQGGLLKSLVDIKPSLIEHLPMNIAIEHVLNPRISSTDLMKRFVNQDRILENVTTYYFENFLNLQERAIVSLDLQQLYANKYDSHNHPAIIELFRTEKRFAEYAEFVELKSFIKHLRDHELSLVYHRNHDYSMRAVERTQQVYENGIDIFRMKTETVGDFAFDHCDLDLVAFALQSKGIRELPVKKSLLYRNRSQRGHQVTDEELPTWSDCLHRFSKNDNEVRPSTEAVIGAVERLYQYKTINYAKKQRRSRGTFFLDYELNPPEKWADIAPQDFIHHRGEYDITHEDYTNAIESHPYLPLYVSGDSRGLVCLWEFNQQDDHSLDQWVTDLEGVKIADVKKHLIKKIQFNGYGDKLYTSNCEGLLSVFNFDNQESSRTAPIFTLKKGKEEKSSDFEILNQDTVFAITSLKPKHTQIYDILMPSRGGLVTEFAIGASVIKPFRSKSQMMLFNVEKPGNMVLFDLKMNKPVFQTNLHQEEVTSVAVTESETTLVAGFRDGYIKIANMEREFETREQYQAFSSVGNKKGGVSQVRIHPTNGALFASSTIGNLKLFRTRV